MPKLTVNVARIDGSAKPGTVVTVRPFWQADPARKGQGIVQGEKAYLADGINFTLTEDVTSAVFDIPSSVEIAGLYDVEISSGAAWTNVFMPDGDTVFNRGLIVDEAPLFSITADSTAGGQPGLSLDQVDARVAAGVRAWARAGSALTIPDNVIPASIARDTEVTSAVNNAVRSASVALGGRIDQLGRRVDDITASSGLTQDQVDARIDVGVADWAEANNATLIPDNKLGTGITRDTELQGLNRALGQRITAAAGALSAARTDISRNGSNISELQTEIAAASRSLADEGTVRANGDDIQSVTVASASSYQSTLNSQQSSAKSLVLVISADISGTRNSEAYSYGRGDVLFFAPLSDSAEYWFTLPGSGGGGSVDLSAYRTSSDQDIIDSRATSGILLARQEAQTAKEIGEAAQEDADASETAITALTGRVAVNETNIGTNQTRIGTNAGGIATNGNLIASATRTIQSLVTEVDTLHPKIGRLVPVTSWVRSNDARTLRFAWFPLDAVTTSTNLVMVIGGVTFRFTAPEAYEATDVDGIILSVSVNASNAGTISREANTVAGHVRVDLSMGDDNFHCYMPSETPRLARYANEDALPATVPAGTIAWFPE